MSEAVQLVQDGQMLAVGGNALHRTFDKNQTEPIW